MRIFGKNLKEYFVPIKYYILGAVLVVISQYVIALPLSDKYPFVLNITQALWALMVAFSCVKLVKNYGFKFWNLFTLGIFYSIIIHGLKVAIRYVFYGRDMTYVIDRFVYGSELVMIIAMGMGIMLPYFAKKKWL